MIDPVTLSALSAAMDAASLRQQVGATNIANVHTAGYKALRVQFEELIPASSTAFERGGRLNPRDVAMPRLTEAPAGTPMPYGANAVSIDQEVAGLARNALHYQALVKSLTGQIALVNAALTDGRR
ncbi:flagellar basal body rod protein FlgB [Achromobacter sp.]|uniref:flagellar basal body rod protein FlgB n=1 Tax=Achromobacter sp. TaxID=134375 RepID=UPI000ECB30E6|nr:flagellar basal body rod protein FlgB [Achromobacter sp.]HCW19633.1 flagellar basal body rod protein FlgB [Achromobacter sp.]